MISQLDTENADRDLTGQIAVLTHTPSAVSPMICQGLVLFGDGAKDLDGTGGDFELTVTVGGQTVQPDPQVMAFSTAIRGAVWTTPFPVPANAAVVLLVKSPNAGDSDVDVTAYLYDVSAAGNVVLLSSGTGTGQLDFTSGVVKSNLAQILGTALTETAGYIAAGFKKLFNVETPVLTVESVNQTIDNPAADAIGTDAAGKVLVTPAQKLVTDASGKVSAIIAAGDIANDAIDAAALAAAAVTKIQAGLALTSTVLDAHAITDMHIGDIAATGVALNRAAESAVVTTGDETNTFAKTDSHDSDYHRVRAVGGAIDFYYQFDINGGGPFKINILGRLDEGVVPSGGDNIHVYAYDWIGLGWDHIEPPTGPFVGIFNSDPTDDVLKSSILFPRHVSSEGKVRIRFFADDLEADTEMFVDLIYLEYAIVPDVAGTAAALHEVTDGLIEDLDLAAAKATIAKLDTIMIEEIP